MKTQAILKVFLIFLGFIYSINLLAQTDREFWFVAPEVTTQHYDNMTYPELGNKVYRGGEPVFLRFTSLEKPASIIITQPANPLFDTIKVSMPANSNESINLTDLGLQDMIENKYGVGGKNNTGLHIESTSLITAYYEVYTKNNPDLFALKGDNALGTEFYVPFQINAPNHSFSTVKAYSAIDIVATVDGTQVWITPSKDAHDGHAAGTQYMITLNKGETYSVCPQDFDRLASSRLAGTHIVSNYPIAITISDDSVQYPGNGCYDLGGDQIIPLDIIGHEYIAMKGKLGEGGQNVRDQLYILATADNTDIYVNGVFVNQIDKGETEVYIFKDTDYAVHVRSNVDKPVYVLHVSGFGCEMGQAILPPTSSCTGSTRVGFTRSNDYPCYLNVMVRKDAFDGFTLNGIPILTNLADWTVPPGDNTWLSAIVDLDALASPNIDGLDYGLLQNSKDIFHMGMFNGNGNGGCRFGYFSDFNELTVDAITAETGTGFYRICDGETVELEAQGGTDFYWTPEDFLDDPYSQFPSLTPHYTTKYVVHVSGACDMVDSAEVTIELLDKVDVNFTIDTTSACAPYEFTFKNISVGADDGYNWFWGDGSPITHETNPILKRTYNNITDTIATYSIKLVGKNISSCRDTMQRTIRLFPEVSADFIQSATIGCQPLVVDFTNLSTGAERAKIPYIWEFGDAGSSAIQSPSHSYSAPNIQNDTTFNVELVIHNEYSCYDTAVSTVTIHPLIDAIFSFAPTLSCNPYDMEISNSSIGVDTYEWNFGDGGPVSNISDPVFNHLYDNQTGMKQIYNINLAVSNTEGCIDSLKKSVTVYPEQSANFTTNLTEGCDSLVIVFTNNSIGASISNWNFGDGASSNQVNPTHVYRNFGDNDTTYIAQLIIGSENMFCRDTMEIGITVHPYINAGFNFSPSSGCTPFTVNITNTSAKVDSYLWDFGDGNTSATNAISFTHNYTNPTAAYTDYNLNLTVTNTEGCTDFMNRKVRVYPNIAANFIMSQPESCYGDTILFTNLSVGALKYEWDFGDNATSSQTNPLHSFEYKGSVDTVYNIRLKAMSDSLSTCTDEITVPLTVHPYLKANFSINKQAGCTPFDLAITNSSVGAISRLWDFGDGNTSTSIGPDITHQFTNAGSTVLQFPVTLVVNSAIGCTDTLIKIISVYPKVTAAFSTTSGCDPHWIADFNNVSQNATIFSWNFGDGASSSVKSPTHTFRNFNTAADTIINVSLHAQSVFGCFDDLTTPLTVYASPNADFNLTSVGNCPPYNVDITNNAQGNDSVYWNFGNGTESNTMAANFSVTYLNPTTTIETFAITQIAVIKSSGCSDTLVRNFSAYPAPTAAFEIQSGCHPLYISDFNNTSTGAVAWNWNFGDGGTSSIKNPTKTFQNTDRENDIQYIVSLTVESFTGCQDTYDTTIWVHHKPDANFNIGDVTGCSPYVTEIANSSIGADSLVWDFGDGGPISNTTDPTFTHNYYNSTNSTISYPISLIAYSDSSCTDTSIHNALIFPDITAHFSIESGCDSLLISNFNNTSVGLVDEYNWNFGDGTSSSLPNPSHYYRNYSNVVDSLYTITLAIENLNGCFASYDTVITIYPRPMADFTIENVPGCSPYPVEITNNSIGNTSLTWDFGDGSPVSNSQDASLVHIYQNLTGSIASFPVTLIASNSRGCTDTITRNAPIYPQVIAEFNVESGCDPLIVSNFNNTSLNADVHNWHFGDEESSDLANPSHTYRNYSRVIDSVYTVNLYVESIYGCHDEYDTTIVVYHKPMAEFSILNSPVCAPDTILITNNSMGMDSCFWNFDDGQYDTTFAEINIEHLYTNTGTLLDINKINLVIRTNEGCTHSVSRSATVYPVVAADFDCDISACSPFTVSFSNMSTGGYTYDWTFGDGNSSNKLNPTNIFYNYSNLVDSIHTTNLLVTSQYGCSAQKDTVITAYPNPQAGFSVLNSPSCSPVDIEISSSAIGVSSIIWDFDDGNIELHSNNSDFTHHYENPGPNYISHSIRQVVRNSRLCYDTVFHDATIYPDITSEFAVNLGGCHPLTIKTQNTSYGAEQHIWKFGDGNGSSSISPEHTYYNYSHTKIDTFNISLQTINNYGCKAFSDTLIVIYPNPKSNFEIEHNNGCSPFDVHLTNISEGAVNYYWTFGDGTVSNTTSDDFYHPYVNDTSDNPVASTIKLVVENEQGCADTLYKIINTYPEVTAEFTGNFEGCSPLLVQFNDASLLAHTYDWQFGDGESSSVKNPNHYYVNEHATDALFNVTLTAYSVYDCSDQITKIVTVYPTPDADFKASPTIQVFPSSVIGQATVTLTDLTQPVSNWNYEWDFGDGATSTAQGSTSHNYTAWNKGDDWYTIQLITTSDKNCIDTATNKIRINSPLPEAVFSMFPIEGCPPLTVQFSNQSSYETSLLWEIKEGDNIIQEFYTENPSFTFTQPGIHDIVLTIEGDGGTTSIDTTVTVFIKPIADLDFSPPVVMLPDGELFLENTSKPKDTIASCEWKIYQPEGDTLTITECEPGSVILEPNHLGLNYVQLIVTTDDGCKDTIISDQQIEVQAPCAVVFPNAFTPIETGKATDGVQLFASTDEEGKIFRSNNTDNDLFFAQVCEDGVIEYHLEIYNRWGEMIYASDNKNEGWNGYYRDKFCKMDVYVWKFTGQCDDGNDLEQVGEVTLIK